MNSPTLSGSFIYDARGRRISKTINGVTTTYQYDNKDVVAEIREGVIQARYLNNPLKVDERYARLSLDSGNEYYHVDALGSTLTLSDQNGMMQSRYTYDPFGNTSMTGMSSNPYQYTGRENDGTGLYFYRARYYSPQLHRFLGEDPILVPFTPLAKGLCLKRNRTEWQLPGQLTTSRPDLGQHVNPFLYLKNGPLQGPDPFGLDQEEDDEDDCTEEVNTCITDSQNSGANCIARLMEGARA